MRSPTNDGSGGMNFRKVTVLSKDHWEGIQYRLNKRQIEAEKVRKVQEEKQRLHDLSVERAKNWSNTILVSQTQTSFLLYYFLCATAAKSISNCIHCVLFKKS